MHFKYRKINLTSPFSKNQISRPIIPISIIFNDKRVHYEALIDSGADFTILPLGLAEILNINPVKSREILFTGVDGGVLKGIIAKVNMEIAGFGYETSIVFAEISGTIGILGQIGFFDKFIIKFDLKKEEIDLKTRI